MRNVYVYICIGEGMAITMVVCGIRQKTILIYIYFLIASLDIENVWYFKITAEAKNWSQKKYFYFFAHKNII